MVHSKFTTLIKKSIEWLAVNCAINDVRRFLPTFYIFKGERLGENHLED
jgi:hypothetical protein